MLSICRKAGKIKMGFDPVENSLYEDAYLVVFAQNASKNTVERMPAAILFNVFIVSLLF